MPCGNSALIYLFLNGAESLTRAGKAEWADGPCGRPLCVRERSNVPRKARYFTGRGEGKALLFCSIIHIKENQI